VVVGVRRDSGGGKLRRMRRELRLCLDVLGVWVVVEWEVLV
jgi:hypothetical protein